MLIALSTMAAITLQNAAVGASVNDPRRLAVAQPSAASTPIAPASDRPVCRKEQETGSLLGGRKICRTQAQWNQLTRDAQDTVNAVTVAGNHRHQ